MKKATVLINLVIVLVLFLNAVALSSVQICELLIIENDTLDMHTAPLKLYLQKQNISIGELFFDFYDNIATTTACFRGYQGVWEIKEGKLNLIEIRNCDRIKASDLGEAFGAGYIDRRVKAEWFTGTIIAIKDNFEYTPGKGYTYNIEKELIIDVYKGTVIKLNKLKPESISKIKDSYRIYHEYFSVMSPKKMDYAQDLPIDSVSFENKRARLSLNGKVVKHDISPNVYGNRDNLLFSLDSLSHLFNNDFEFQTYPTYKMQNWGYIAWIDAYSNSKSKSLRIIIKECIDMRIILFFSVSDRYRYKFKDYAEKISNSISLAPTLGIYY